MCNNLKRTNSALAAVDLKIQFEAAAAMTAKMADVSGGEIVNCYEDYPDPYVIVVLSQLWKYFFADFLWYLLIMTIIWHNRKKIYEKIKLDDFLCHIIFFSKVDLMASVNLTIWTDTEYTSC